MKKLNLFLCLVIAIFYSSLSPAQTKVDPAEISSSVPELTEFHKVIFPIWHNAYPSKDYEALKGFIPQIKTSMESINNARLPGILRDKETEWKTVLNELNKAAQKYYTAAQANDNAALLAAAESLHSNYEKMIRVIRPAIKELDDFHQTLYVVYHKLYPDKKYDEIAGLTGTLVTKAEAIMNYPQDKLKQRLGDNADKFNVSAKELYNSTVSLKDALNGSDLKKKSDAVESMHSAYQDLDALF